MIVVADSSPLVVLTTIKHQGILPALFHRVVIPPEVASELNSPNRPEAVRAFLANAPDWLEVRAASLAKLIPGLHAGESAAIALAQEIAADRIIIDERLGRQEASARRLQVIGTIGVLEAAAERDLLDLEKAFEQVKQTDFWISPHFLDERLALFRVRQADRRHKADLDP